MTTNTMAYGAATATRTAGPCDCGCGGQGECCRLDCLVQPRFFCGQLLADGDLTALVDWVKAKAGLARFRHGWGVVCGLDVACGDSGAIRVSPGYAMDCCGRDVVICTETTLSLADCIAPLVEHCRESNAQQQQAPPPGNISFSGWEIARKDVVTVDVLLRYAETPAESRPALARGGCGGTTGCEYARTQESYTLYCKPASHCDDPLAGTQDWTADYVKARGVLLQDLARLFKSGDAQTTLNNVLGYLRKNPLHTFCFIAEQLSALQNTANLTDAWFNNAVFWIVQDWRFWYLRSRCAECGPDTSIPLARVWAWRRRDDRGRETYTPVYINARPPYRRPIENPATSAPPGMINLAPFLWQRIDEAWPAIKRAGVNSFTAEIVRIDTLQSLQAQLDREAILLQASMDNLIIHLIPDLCNQPRIVYFSRPVVFTPPRNVPRDHPGVQLTSVMDQPTADRFRAAGIENLIDLANAPREKVEAASKPTPEAPVDLAAVDELIKRAQAQLEKVRSEV